MTKFSSMNRRAALGLFAGALLAASSTALAGSSGATGNPIQSGTYVGKWRDGTKLTEQVVFGEGHIRMTRISGGQGVGTSSLFAPVGKNLYRNASGSTIKIKSNRRFTWRNRSSGHIVRYRHKD